MYSPEEIENKMRWEGKNISKAEFFFYKHRTFLVVIGVNNTLKNKYVNRTYKHFYFLCIKVRVPPHISILPQLQTKVKTERENKFMLV